MNWKGFCQEERNKAIFDIEQTVSQFGYIIDFHRYTDMELCLKIELPGKNVPALHQALKARLMLDTLPEGCFESDKEQNLFITITFAVGTGNMKIEVPAVPG